MAPANPRRLASALERAGAAGDDGRTGAGGGAGGRLLGRLLVGLPDGPQPDPRPPDEPRHRQPGRDHRRHPHRLGERPPCGLDDAAAVPIGTEYICTSITAGGAEPATFFERTCPTTLHPILRPEPRRLHVRRPDARLWRTDFHQVASLLDPASTVEIVARYATEAGRPESSPPESITPTSFPVSPPRPRRFRSVRTPVPVQPGRCPSYDPVRRSGGMEERGGEG
jgi:hypothetical protein